MSQTADRRRRKNVVELTKRDKVAIEKILRKYGIKFEVGDTPADELLKRLKREVQCSQAIMAVLEDFEI
jgi:mannose/fructose/N-acetylgalactosamine-specific phosphotransferase system component IIB